MYDVQLIVAPGFSSETFAYDRCCPPWRRPSVNRTGGLSRRDLAAKASKRSERQIGRALSVAPITVLRGCLRTCGGPIRRAPSPKDKERDLAQLQIRERTHDIDQTMDLTIGPSVEVDPVPPATPRVAFAQDFCRPSRARETRNIKPPLLRDRCHGGFITLSWKKAELHELKCIGSGHARPHCVTWQNRMIRIALS